MSQPSATPPFRITLRELSRKSEQLISQGSNKNQRLFNSEAHSSPAPPKDPEHYLLKAKYTTFYTQGGIR